MISPTKTQSVVFGGIILLLVIAAFFMANVEMPPWAGYVSGVNVVLFAIPAFWASRRWLGWRDAVLLWAMLGVLALTLETFAIVTGFPYGHFGYSDLLGYRLFGYAPWTVFLAWTPLVLGAWAIASQWAVGRGRWALRIGLTAAITVVFDLVLDPGAVRLGFWKYAEGGEFYGVPLSNFLGWLVSGSIGALLIELMVIWKKPLLRTPVQLAFSAYLIVFFWAAIALFSQMYLAVIAGVVAAIIISETYRRKGYAFDDMVVLVDESNREIGTSEKLPTHTDDTPLHRAFSIFLFNESGELLLQQRAATKKTWPLTWSNSCCGHVMLHEATIDAAKRRLKFELGISGVAMRCLLPEFRYRAEKDGIVENEICPVFVGFTSSQPKPNPDEVESTKWVPWQEFLDESRDSESGISPWAREEALLLASNSDFQRMYRELAKRA